MTGHKISLADEAVITALTAKQAELETEIEYLHNELASMKTGPYSDLLKENRKLRHELAVLVHGIDAESERLRGQLAAVTAERDELKATIGYETQYKKAYIELSGKTGELETKINELRNKVQKTEAERDHYHRERDIWVRSNKQLQEQLASVKKERDELKAYWFDDADPSETKYANEYALAKVGMAEEE